MKVLIKTALFVSLFLGFNAISNHEVEKNAKRAYALGCRDQVETYYAVMADLIEIRDVEEIAQYKKVLLNECDHMGNDFDVRELDKVKL